MGIGRKSVSTNGFLLLPLLLLGSVSLIVAQVNGNGDKTAPNYYDLLREQVTENGEYAVPVQGSNLFQVSTTTTTEGEGDAATDDDYILLGDLTTFIAFTDGVEIRPGNHNDAAVALLAAYHFNNLYTNGEDGDGGSVVSTSPIITADDVLDDGSECRIKLTLNILDSQFSPIESTRVFTQMLQRNHSLTEPLPAAVVGAYRSATTSPLAILTGVNDITQVSYASTSTDFDVKEQFPRFGRTISSSTGEARSVLDLFLDLGAKHVAVLFVTVRFSGAF